MNSARFNRISILSPIATALFLFVLASCLLVYFYPNAISGDQGFITFTLSFASLPSFSGGITTQLIVGLYNQLIHPSIDRLSVHIRTLALILYVAPACWLAATILRKRKFLLMFILFLFSSRYPFLWLSSELFVGAFLFLVFVGFIKKWNSFGICASIVFLGHTKPDLILLSAVFMIVLLIKNVKNHRLVFFLTVFYVMLNILLVMPEIISNGWQWSPLSRSFVSFSQHYAALVYGHQLTDAPLPFGNETAYMKAIFPKAHSLKEVVWYYPQQYYDFLFLSLAHGLKRIVVLFHALLLFIPLIYRAAKTGKYRMDDFEKLFFICCIGFIPLVLFSFPHIRYMARFYPLAVIFVLSYLEKTSDQNRRSTISTILISAALAINIAIFLNSTALIPSGNYWFPD